MDGDFGVEGIRYFSNFRAANSWAKKMADTKFKPVLLCWYISLGTGPSVFPSKRLRQILC
jgi:hypothetical protein